jgi:sulfur relay (sulfurtransferase) DsrF/TusC family protein
VRVAPELDRDLLALAGQGVAVYVVEEDLRERGIPADAVLPGVERVGRDRLAGLIDACDRVIRG